MSPRTALALGASALLAACTSQPTLTQSERDRLGQVAGRVREDALRARIAALAEAHGTDRPLSCDGLDTTQPRLCNLTDQRSREALRQAFAEEGLVAREHHSDDPRWPSTNLVVELPGASQPDEVILVGAHQDAFWQGADDNSSGAVALVEVAHALAGMRLARTVRLVAFDLEEIGLVGSGRYVNEGQAQGVKLALVMDAIGFYSTAPGSQTSIPGLPAPDQGDFLAVIADEPSEPALRDLLAVGQTVSGASLAGVVSPRDGAEPALGDLLRSDHANFWLAGMPALFFTDTANFRNPHYHRATDTPDTLDYPRYARSVAVIAAMAAHAAGSAP